MSEPSQPASSVASIMRRFSRSRALIPLALVGMILLFFNKMAFSNLILARGDTFLYFYPYWTAAADALRGGRIPLWNADIFMGAPFLANSQAGIFYPLNWPVWLLLSTPYAVSASILIHLVIVAGGAYLAGRRVLALGRTAALFAATLFALGGYLSAQVEHINQLQGLAWLPWFFVILAPLVDPPEDTPANRTMLLAILGIGALFALQLLAGHTQTAFISGVAIALWLALNALTGFSRQSATDGSRKALLRFAAALMAGVALAVALSAVQLLPTLELAGQSSRQGGLSLNEVLSFSWHPLHLTRALLPGYGQALFTEYVAFLPLTALALVVTGAWGWRKNPALRPWLALVGIALLLALGRFTPGYYLLGRLPGFDLFRAPARWLAVAALGASLLAGYGWQRLRLFATTDWPAASDRGDARAELIRPLVVAGAGLILLILWGYAAGRVAGTIPAGAESPYEPPTPTALLGWLIEMVLAGLLFWVVLTGPRRRAVAATGDLIVLTLAALWLGSRGLPYNQLTTPEAYFDLRPPQARLSALTDCAVPGRPCSLPGRFLSLSDIFFDPGDMAEIESIYADQLDPAALYDYIVAVKHKEVLSPNLSMVTGLPSVDGFDGGILPLQTYSELMRLILPTDNATTDGRLREYLSAAPELRWLSLFNGRYLITDKTGDVWREGIFFDRQHPAQPAGGPVMAGRIPDYEATALWLISEGTPPPVRIATAGAAPRLFTPQLVTAPDLYRIVFPAPITPKEIALLPCPTGALDCGAAALTLVDDRDDSFQPLAVAPYRLLYSGDVKIYENEDVQPRAFLVYDWQWAADTAAAVEGMSAADFDPRVSAVVTGVAEGLSPPGDGRGTVEVAHYQPETVVLRATSADDALLILTDAYYPGWEASIDGSPATIRQVDGLFRGVFLPAGEHVVEFNFRPASFRRGGLVSLAGLGLVVFGVAILIRGWNRKGRPSAG